MKALRLLALFAIFVALFAVVGAQDYESLVPADLSGSFVSVIDEGALVADEDGAYTLSLSKMPEYMRWQYISPELTAGRFQTNFLAAFWAANEGLTASAVLETADVIVELTLSAPTYDMETGLMSFDAVIDSVEFASMTDSKDEAVAPESFADATLYIVIDHAFVVGINEGSQMTGVRLDVGNSTELDKGDDCSFPNC